MRWRKPVSKVEREYVSVIAISGERSRKACATPLTILAAPGPRVERHIPGLPVRSPQVAANIAPATSCFIRRNRICRWRAASISSTDSPPGCPTMNGVPASLNALAITSTVVDISPPRIFVLWRERSTVAADHTAYPSASSPDLIRRSRSGGHDVFDTHLQSGLCSAERDHRVKPGDDGAKGRAPE